MNYATDYLARHPLLGAAASTGGSIFTFFQSVELGLRCAGAVVGLAIGLITLIGMYLRKKARERARLTRGRKA